MHTSHSSKSLKNQVFGYLTIILGALLAAFAIDVFFIPNNLIDGGIVGVSMIGAYLIGQKFFPLLLILFNIPFVFLAYKTIGRVFVYHTLFAQLCFSFFTFFFHSWLPWTFTGETLEVVVIGGSILGVGLGLIIRYGGCLDGTEIMGIIVNKQTGITVGQVVLVSNIFVFAAAGLAYQDWHTPLLSLIAYIVVIKIMDAVIVGLDETKSVLIISTHSQAVADAIMHELGLGLTVMYGRGGYSGDEREILYVIVERLQLAELKELIYREDPAAFIAIENLHEIANGNQGRAPTAKSKTRVETLFSRLFQSNQTTASRHATEQSEIRSRCAISPQSH